MINLISILTVCQTLAQMQIPEYTSGYIPFDGNTDGGTLAAPTIKPMTFAFSITFQATPQMFLSTNQIEENKGQICISATITALSLTEFTVELAFCAPVHIGYYGLYYLAVNDPYVYIHNQMINPSSSLTTQTITFGNHNWVQAPAYSIAIIGMKLQSQTIFYHSITISQITINSATITVTENNLVGLYYPIQFNIIFTCPEFIKTVSQAFDWESGYFTLVVGYQQITEYSFVVPKLPASVSPFVKIEGFSAFGYSTANSIKLYCPKNLGIIGEGYLYFPELKLTYSAFNYQPFVCNGTTIGNQCTCADGFYISFSGCLKCSASCRTCVTILSNCLTCNPNQYFNSGLCFCNSGYFMNAVLSCSQCNVNCLTCNTQSTFCTSCSTDKVLISNHCEACPSKTQNLNGACIACQSNCDSCYLAYCIQCSPTYLYQKISCNSATVFFCFLISSLYNLEHVSVNVRQDIFRIVFIHAADALRIVQLVQPILFVSLVLQIMCSKDYYVNHHAIVNTLVQMEYVLNVIQLV